jgi:hypothetical protein
MTGGVSINGEPKGSLPETLEPARCLPVTGDAGSRGLLDRVGLFGANAAGEDGRLGLRVC